MLKQSVVVIVAEKTKDSIEYLLGPVHDVIFFRVDHTFLYSNSKTVLLSVPFEMRTARLREVK